jgi:hypothetical protein
VSQMKSEIRACSAQAEQRMQKHQTKKKSLLERTHLFLAQDHAKHRLTNLVGTFEAALIKRVNGSIGSASIKVRLTHGVDHTHNVPYMEVPLPEQGCQSLTLLVAGACFFYVDPVRTFAAKGASRICAQNCGTLRIHLKRVTWGGRTLDRRGVSYQSSRCAKVVPLVPFVIQYGACLETVLFVHRNHQAILGILHIEKQKIGYCFLRVGCTAASFEQASCHGVCLLLRSRECEKRVRDNRQK